MGTFTVRPGDCVSKYHWAVFGSWGADASWRKYFQQVLPGPNNTYILKPLRDPNCIDVGWRMTYVPDFKPPKQAPGGGGQIGINPPEPGGGGGAGPWAPPVAISYQFFEAPTPIRVVGPLQFRFVVSGTGAIKGPDAIVNYQNLEKLKIKIPIDLADSWKTAIEVSLSTKALLRVEEVVEYGEKKDWASAMAEMIRFQSMGKAHPICVGLTRTHG